MPRKVSWDKVGHVRSIERGEVVYLKGSGEQFGTAGQNSKCVPGK